MNTTMIKHKWKYTNPDVYINGIRKQNEAVGSIQTIPVYGITNKAMKYIQDKIISKDEIIDISPAAKTAEYGRWNVYTTAETFEKTAKWLENNLQTLYNDHCTGRLAKTDVPEHFVPEVKFNNIMKFNAPTPDNHIDIAATSVSRYSSSQANSWASVVSGYHNYSVQTKPTSTETSTISSDSHMTKMLQDIHKSIETICTRLDNIEARLDEHDQAIQRIQQFETDAQANMERLVQLIQKLEERTTRIIPRRLDHSFVTMESNKRQDTRSSPGKGLQRE